MLNDMANEMNEKVTRVINTEEGVHVADGPLTTPVTQEGAPGLLLNEVEQRIVKVRPMSTPVDQITRMAGSRTARSIEVSYYKVDTKPGEAKLVSATEIAGTTIDNCAVYKLKTDNDEIFSPTETILMPDMSGERMAGSDTTRNPAVLYVVSRESTSDGWELRVIAVNGKKSDGIRKMPATEGGEALIRMGRAASELDVQTGQYQSLPKKASNYCQIFKAQIEHSTVMNMTRKEVGWTMEDQEESAITDMRLGMEKSFIFGCKARLTNELKGDETLLTQGIWSQAAGVATIEKDLTHKALTALMRRAFTGKAAGSNRKILIAGSGLIERLSNLESVRTLSAQDKVTRWGIDFTEIGSKFGTLYTIHSEVFDMCGHPEDGMIIDPAYITKYCFEPFKAEHLDLKSSGVRNCDAVVLTEASCVVLRHPEAHLRVITE